MWVKGTNDLYDLCKRCCNDIKSATRVFNGLRRIGIRTVEEFENVSVNDIRNNMKRRGQQIGEKITMYLNNMKEKC